MIASGETSLVEALALTKFYGQNRAVCDVSFSIKRGEVVGFLGPNGAGKSTTMKMLCGYLKPSAGQAKLAGIDVAADPLAARRMLGYLPENAPLYEDMMVVDFLRFVGRLRGLSAARVRTRMADVIEHCGLLEVVGKDIGQLSKGYRQRVGLAQALLHDPPLLILDEPTSGLDPNQILGVRSLIADLGREKTILLSTHILSEVQAMCHRILVIHQGEVVADKPIDEVGEGESCGAIEIWVKQRAGQNLSLAQVQAILAHIPGVREIAPVSSPAQPVDSSAQLGLQIATSTAGDLREEIFEAAVANNLIILSMQRKTQSLEQTFHRLTSSASQTEESAAASPLH